MLGLLHGEAGGWDEVAIAVAAFAVLWLAVKLAGRKSAAQGEDEDVQASEAAPADVAQPSDAAEELDRAANRNR